MPLQESLALALRGSWSWGLGKTKVLCLLRSCVPWDRCHHSCKCVFHALEPTEQDRNGAVVSLVSLLSKPALSACRAAVHAAEEHIQTGRNTPNLCALVAVFLLCCMNNATFLYHTTQLLDVFKPLFNAILYTLNYWIVQIVMHVVLILIILFTSCFKTHFTNGESK